MYNFKLEKYDEEYYRIYNKLKKVNFDKIPSFRWIKNRINMNQGSILLDAGCGDGHLLNYYCRNGLTGIGADLTYYALKIAQERHNKNIYINTDLRTLSFKSESFNTIVCFNVIEHILEQDQVMQEFQRILKPKGILIIGTNIRDSICWWLYQKFIGEKTHVKEFTVSEFIEIVFHYFKVEEYTVSSGIFRLPPPISWIFHYLLKGDIIIKASKK